MRDNAAAIRAATRRLLIPAHCKTQPSARKHDAKINVHRLSVMGAADEAFMMQRARVR